MVDNPHAGNAAAVLRAPGVADDATHVAPNGGAIAMPTKRV